MGHRALQPPRFDVADVVRANFADPTAQHRLTPEQRKAVRDITRCRTAALGGHLQRCLACGDERPVYNSCRNRHCPKCQALAQAKWVNAQLQRILPVGCFHLVFTLPAELRGVARGHPRQVYNLLFEAASGTLLTLGRNPKWLGARLGITAVLHTWARDLTYHPHLHCIVTAGGLTEDGTRFVHADSRFLFPVAALGQVFRSRVLEGLRRMRMGRAPVAPWLNERAFQRLVDGLYRTRWNVYAKAPFAGPKQVFRYLGQYTHRVGLSNHRLLDVTHDNVSFRTRGDSAVSIPKHQFVKRLLAHILPPRFVKIRHYGLMANGHMAARRERARQLLQADAQSGAPRRPRNAGLAVTNWEQALLRLTGVDLRRCTRCGQLAVVREPLHTRPQLVANRPRPPPSNGSHA